MTKHIIIDWANVCHQKKEWKRNNWRSESDFNTISEILNSIKKTIGLEGSDDIKFYIIFPYGGLTLPPFASSFGSVTFPENANEILDNSEIYWPGGFNLTESSPDHKKIKFNEKCSITKKNNPLHSCSSPDDLFILWKAAEINDIDNTYIITDDKFGSEKNFIKICNENNIKSLSNLVHLCNNYQDNEKPSILVQNKDEYLWYQIDKDTIKKKVPFIDTFNKIVDGSVNIISSKNIGIVDHSDEEESMISYSENIKAGQVKKIQRKKTKKKKKKTKKKKKKTKKKKTKNSIKLIKDKKPLDKLIDLEEKLKLSPQNKRYEILENYFKSGKIRKILPKQYKIFSWLTPIAMKGFNALEDSEYPTMYEISVPAGSRINKKTKKKKEKKKKKKKSKKAGLFDDTRLKLFGKNCSEYRSCPEDTINTNNSFLDSFDLDKKEKECCEKVTNQEYSHENDIKTYTKEALENMNDNNLRTILVRKEKNNERKRQLIEMNRRTVLLSEQEKNDLIKKILDQKKSDKGKKGASERWRRQRDQKKRKRLKRVKDESTIQIYINSGYDFEPLNLHNIKPGNNKHHDGIFIPSYNGIDLTKINYISGGAHGEVRKYSDENDKIIISIKSFKGGLYPLKKWEDFYEEYKIIELGSFIIETLGTPYSANDKCSMINARGVLWDERYNEFIEVNENKFIPLYTEPYILMEKMDSSLPIKENVYNNPYNSSPEAPFKNFIKVQFDIIKEIARNMKCLMDHGYYYTDLKTGNILYKLFDDQLKIYFGDLGSIYDADKKDNRAVWTFPPIETEIKDFKINETSLIWPLGVLFLSLLFGPHYTHQLNLNHHNPISLLNIIEKKTYWKTIKERGKIIKNRNNEDKKKFIKLFYTGIKNEIKKYEIYESISGINCGGNKYNLYEFIIKLFAEPSERFSFQQLIDMKINIQITKPTIDNEFINDNYRNDYFIK
jgi:hypothetical protein